MIAAVFLLVLTLGVIVLPLLPALREWRRPTDVTPLPIDEADALEPDYLARRFAQRIDAALAQGVDELGGTALSMLPRSAAWPSGLLTRKEQRTGRSERIWYGKGDAVLPEGLHGLAEIAARGTLRAAAGHTYRALLAGGRLTLPPRVRVLRWAHGRSVAVGDLCRVPGRLSADELILMGRNVSFALLHAPTICFAGALPSDAQGTLAGIEGVRWEVSADGAWDGAHSVAMVDHSMSIPALRHWEGDLMGAAHLTLGEGCVARGSVKAAGMISLGAGCQVHGGLMAAGEIYLAPGAQVRASIVSETAVVLGPGCVVGVPGAHATVRAPRVEVGQGVVVHGTVWSGSMRLAVGDPLGSGPPGEPDLDDLVAWNEVTGRGVAGNSLTVAPGRAWDGDLVCHGDLALGPRCHAAGGLKAHGAIGLGAGCAVDGSVIAHGEVVVGAGVQVLGSVASESAVLLGPGCIVGAPGRPATVCAPRIEVALGVVVHGTVWAGDSGDALDKMQLVADGADDSGVLPGRALA